MGREIRRVPVEFNHPVVWRERYKGNGPLFERPLRWVSELQPMYDRPLSEAQAEWDAARATWDGSREATRVYTQDDLDRAIARRDDPDPLRRQSGIDSYIEHVSARIGQPVYESFEEYHGERPGKDAEDAAYYQPEGWPPEDERGYVVYETVSEGTPITPCFATREELVDWLSTHGTGWDAPISREAAERWVFGSGWMPSVIAGPGIGVVSGMAQAELVKEQ